MLSRLRDGRHKFCKLQDCTLNVSNLFLSIPLLSYDSQNVGLNSKSVKFFLLFLCGPVKFRCGKQCQTDRIVIFLCLKKNETILNKPDFPFPGKSWYLVGPVMGNIKLI